MADFFRSQLDYIFFVYGAAFFLLVPICLFLRHRHQCCRLTWGWMGLFGAAHGVNEWLDLLALSLETGPLFALVRVSLLIVSFAFLAEFGRSSLATMRGRGPGRWVLVVLAGLAALGGLGGVAGVSAAARYWLGLVGGLWAAGALLDATRVLPMATRQFRTAALGMGLYALVAGLVPNPAPFFPASWLNYNSVLEFTGIPIQLIRGGLAVWISVSLSQVAQACLRPEEDLRQRIWFRNLLWGGMASLGLLIIGGWFFTQYLGDSATRERKDDYEQNAEVVSQAMQERLLELERLVRLMSQWPSTLPALKTPTPETVAQANGTLDFFCKEVPDSVCYLMNLEGLTIASSNRHSPDAFVGQSYAFRPYFQEARQGEVGKYFALGATSGKMGYYVSSPVRDRDGKILGVVVIKRSPIAMETLVDEHYLGFITDRHGIVVMSNRPDLLLRSLWPLTKTAKAELTASRQFGEGPFPPILNQEPVDGGKYLVQEKTMMAARRPAAWEDWSIVILGSIWPISQARLLGISITLLLNLALVGFAAVIIIMREGEEHFRQLFENAADSLILHDGDRVMEVNQQATLSLGYTREELLRMPLSDIEVGDRPEGLMILEENDGRPPTFSSSFRRKDGSTFPADVRVGEVAMEGQKLRLAAIRDITEQRQAEEALQAERQRLYNLLDGLQAYIYLRRPDCSLVYVNQYFRERFGEPGDQPCYKILHNRQEPCKGCHSEKVFATGNPEEWEWASNTGRVFRIYDYPFADVDGQPLVLEMGIDITRHKQAEEGLRASQQALRRNEERYRTLAGHLLTAQEAERKRLARELHDDLSQRLAALTMEAEILERQTPNGRKADSVRMKEIKDKLVELSIDVHAMSRRLHPSILDDLGLADAVASECETFRKRHGVRISFRAENIAREVPSAVAVCLYRIAQEALRNISRHAGATEVNISLVGEEQAIRMAIKDNGRGFNVGWKNSKVGLGLESMKERAYLIGGDFSVTSQPGHGTTIEVLAPLRRRVA